MYFIIYKKNLVRIFKFISNYYKISVRCGFWLYLFIDFGGIFLLVFSRYILVECGILNKKKNIIKMVDICDIKN